MENKLKKSTLDEMKDMIHFCLKTDWILSSKQLKELNKMINVLEKYVNGK